MINKKHFWILIHRKPDNLWDCAKHNIRLYFYPVKTLDPELEILTRTAHTIQKPVSYSGIGIHTGNQVTLTFIPAEVGAGVVFKRVDLPGAPIVPAKIENVCDTTRSTTIGKNGVFVCTVEHVLAAVKAYQIDNLIIEVSDNEPPIGDGSSAVFTQMIEAAGVLEQDQQIKIVKLREPVFWSRGDSHIIAVPYEGFRASYSLHYPNAKALQHQHVSFMITPEIFQREIAPCRTFSRYEEVEILIDRGLIKGGSLANNLVIKDDVVFSSGGLHFQNEMARHKLLDLVGDLSLIELDLHAHIIANRTGHEANYLFAGKLIDSITTEQSHECTN